MAKVYETPNFRIDSHEKPFVSRTDGGHIRIWPKEAVTDRTKLSPKLAIELMRLTMLGGEALQVAMNSRGVPVVRVNYEDLGNWAYKRNAEPVMHIHILGRASNAKVQVFPEAVQLPDRGTGFYDGFEPLDTEDVKAIQTELARLESQPKYKLSAWGLDG